MREQVQRGLIVLLAEDDENDVILIRRAAERLPLLGLLLLSVADGGEVIDYLCGKDQYGDRSAHPFPNVLLLDQVMPRLTGLDTLSWLRSEPRFEHLPVVVFSGGFTPAQREMVERLNAVCAVKAQAFQEMPSVIEHGIQGAISMVNYHRANAGGPELVRHLRT